MLNLLKAAVNGLANDWRQAWSEAELMRPKPFDPTEDYLHGLKQLAAYGTPIYKERAQRTLQELGEQA